MLGLAPKAPRQQETELSPIDRSHPAIPPDVGAKQNRNTQFDSKLQRLGLEVGLERNGGGSSICFCLFWDGVWESCPMLCSPSLTMHLRIKSWRSILIKCLQKKGPSFLCFLWDKKRSCQPALWEVLDTLQPVKPSDSFCTGQCIAEVPQLGARFVFPAHTAEEEAKLLSWESFYFQVLQLIG